MIDTDKRILDTQFGRNNCNFDVSSVRHSHQVNSSKILLHPRAHASDDNNSKNAEHCALVIRKMKLVSVLVSNMEWQPERV